MDDENGRLSKALDRYKVIAAYIAMEPPRGERRKMLLELAARTWVDSQGEPFKAEVETLRVWIRRYRKGGLEALKDKQRRHQGQQSAISDAQAELFCRLKAEVPERSLDRLIAIAEQVGLCEPGEIRRSTLHRALQKRGLSARKAQVPDTQDLDRFEAKAPNDTWQSDMLVGPWLPDPDNPKKKRRTYLYLFLDDHSRRLLYGRFDFKGHLPALELVFRRSLQRYGVPRRVYYDNGQVYRSLHMKRIVATLGIDGIAFTKVRRPMGHGKVEALNRFVRSAFLSELKASNITTLERLNEAFFAWSELEYNRKVHSETGASPEVRWATGSARFADERLLDEAFTWAETRTTDKSGLFSLFGVKYQSSAALARRNIEVRYDPEALEEVELWLDGKFVERVRAFKVKTHRRAHSPSRLDNEDTKPAEPVVDWLSHLVAERHRRLAPEAREEEAQRTQARIDCEDRLVKAVEATVDESVFDEHAVRAFIRRFGPFNEADFSTALVTVLKAGIAQPDHPLKVTLEAVRRHTGSGK